jgi:hypothetical protein
MKFKTMVLIAVAFGLCSLSHSLELRGDLAPMAARGVSTERLSYHLIALALLLAALGCFVFAGLNAFRAIRDR